MRRRFSILGSGRPRLRAASPARVPGHFAPRGPRPRGSSAPPGSRPAKQRKYALSLRIVSNTLDPSSLLVFRAWRAHGCEGQARSRRFVCPPHTVRQWRAPIRGGTASPQCRVPHRARRCDGAIPDPHHAAVHPGIHPTGRSGCCPSRTSHHARPSAADRLPPIIDEFASRRRRSRSSRRPAPSPRGRSSSATRS